MGFLKTNRECVYLYIGQSPSGKVYIGQSINFKRRLNTHESLARLGKKSPLYNAMRKYGEDFKWQVLGQADRSVIDHAEEFLIRSYRSNEPAYGYNIMAGPSDYRKNNRQRAVICVTDGREFPSITQAAEFYNLSVGNVCSACKGVLKTSGGRIFKYRGMA